MTVYNPDHFVLLRIITKKETYFKVLGGWSGGYAYGSSWRMNSGIKSYKEDKDTIEFEGFSGSVYVVNKEREGMSLAMPPDLDSQEGVEYINFEDFLEEFDQ